MEPLNTESLCYFCEHRRNRDIYTPHPPLVHPLQPVLLGDVLQRRCAISGRRGRVLRGGDSGGGGRGGRFFVAHPQGTVRLSHATCGRCDSTKPRSRREMNVVEVTNRLICFVGRTAPFVSIGVLKSMYLRDMLTTSKMQWGLYMGRSEMVAVCRTRWIRRTNAKAN